MKKKYIFVGIGVTLLALIAGGLAWQKRTSPAPTAPSPTTEPTRQASRSLTLSPKELVSQKNTLLGKKVTLRGYARRATGPCTG